mgnify:CR=1 FL=1
MSSWNSFEDIEAWQLSRDFCNKVYKLMSETELKNDFRLKDQLNGSAGSIMDNIAEGFERGGNKEFIQFLTIAKASAGESRSQLYRVHDRKYISQNEFEALINQVTIISGKLGNLIKYLKSSEFKGSKFNHKFQVE